MTFSRGKITRRAALASLGGLPAAARLEAGSIPEVQGQDSAPPPPPGAIPVKGKAGPGLEPFDAAVLQIMDRHGVPGAALGWPRTAGWSWPRATAGPTSPGTSRSSPTPSSASPACPSRSPRSPS